MTVLFRHGNALLVIAAQPDDAEAQIGGALAEHSTPDFASVELQDCVLFPYVDNASLDEVH